MNMVKKYIFIIDDCKNFRYISGAKNNIKFSKKYFILFLQNCRTLCSSSVQLQRILTKLYFSEKIFRELFN